MYFRFVKGLNTLASKATCLLFVGLRDRPLENDGRVVLYMYMRGLLPLLVGQTPSPENHAKLLFTTGIYFE
jgi:hypothetical protein